MQSSAEIFNLSDYQKPVEGFFDVPHKPIWKEPALETLDTLKAEASKFDEPVSAVSYHIALNMIYKLPNDAPMPHIAIDDNGFYSLTWNKVTPSKALTSLSILCIEDCLVYSLLFEGKSKMAGTKIIENDSQFNTAALEFHVILGDYITPKAITRRPLHG